MKCLPCRRRRRLQLVTYTRLPWYQIHTIPTQAAAAAAPVSASSSPARAKRSPSPSKKPQEGGGGGGGAAAAPPTPGSAAKRLQQAAGGEYWKVGEGKRARKAVEVLTVAPSEGREVVVKPGKGTALGEMEGVVEAFRKVPGKDPLLKKLHSMAFGKPGKAIEVKVSSVGLVFGGWGWCGFGGMQWSG
jgi:hypothetical protein